jgi:hypothetical protein
MSSTEAPQVKNTREIGPTLLTRLAEVLPPEEIAERIRDMLNATYETKNGDVKTDWRAVEAAIKLYLAYQLGMPVQRQVIVQQAPEAGSATMDRLMSSPAAVKVLEQMLAKARSGAVEIEAGDTP